MQKIDRYASVATLILAVCFMTFPIVYSIHRDSQEFGKTVEVAK